MVTAPTSSPEVPEPTNSVGRIFGALFNPRVTFESIAKRPTWLAPLILMCLVQIGVVGSFSHRVGWHDFLEKQMENNSRVQQMPSAQREQLVNQQAKYAPAMGYAGAAIAPFIGAAIVGAIFLAVFNLLSGTKLGFKTSLGIVSYAWLPMAILGLLGIVVIFLKDPSTVDLQNLVASNPAVILADGSPKWLIALAGSVDLFSFWTMFLLATGYHAANPKKISFGNALGSVVSVWLVYVIVKVGLAAMFS